jgi:hypothetical protein
MLYMKRLRDRIGFSGGAGAMLVIGVIVLAAVGGLLYHHLRLVSNRSASNVVTTAPVTPAQQESIASVSPQQPVQQRLDVKEWGVQLPLPTNIGDAYYVVSTNTRDPATGQPNTMWLGLASLNSDGCDATHVNNGRTTSTPLGALIRVAPTETDPVSGALYTQKYPTGVLLGDYYYVYVPWKNKACASKAASQGVDSAFGAAAKGIVKASAATN